MKNKIKFMLVAIAMMSGLALTTAPVLTDLVYADEGTECLDSDNPLECGTKTPGVKSDATLPGIIKKVTNLLLYLVGAISVIMLIFGGFRYTTSGGAPDKVGAAKSTILYAIIGIIVSMTAYAIINFVITSFQSN